MASKKHRKLFFDPRVINVTAFCQPYCEPIGDDSRICPPLICKKTCPYTCTNPFPSLIPPLKPPPPPPPTATHHQKTLLQNGHLYLIISLSVLAVLCFIFSTYTIYKYYANRNRGSPPQPPLPQDENDHTHDQLLDQEHGPVLDHPIWYIRTVGLQQSAINAITILRFKKGDGLVEGTECSVCLNEFQDDETLRLLPKCNHAFHLPCIDTWLRSHTNCPLCRAGIVSDTPAPPARPVRAPPGQEADPAIREEDQPVVGENSVEEVEERGFIVEEDETSSEEDVVGKVEHMRRSVSLDCLSASMISKAIANESSGDTKLVKLKDLGGSSMGEPILMKRSVSCSGDVLMKKSTARSQN